MAQSPGNAIVPQRRFPRPGENRVKLDEVGPLLQGLPPQFLGNLGQRLPLPIAQPDAVRSLVAQDEFFDTRYSLHSSSFWSTDPLI